MKIDITPDAAISILSFLREFVKKGESLPDETTFLSQCVDEFESSVLSNITEKEFDDVMENIRIKALIGHSPPMRG